MVSDKANVQKRFNELKRYFTRVFNDPSDVGTLILNPLLAQVFAMPEDFVALLPKVAAARKEVCLLRQATGRCLKRFALLFLLILHLPDHLSAFSCAHACPIVAWNGMDGTENSLRERRWCQSYEEQ